MKGHFFKVSMTLAGCQINPIDVIFHLEKVWKGWTKNQLKNQIQEWQGDKRITPHANYLGNKTSKKWYLRLSSDENSSMSHQIVSARNANLGDAQKESDIIFDFWTSQPQLRSNRGENGECQQPLYWGRCMASGGRPQDGLKHSNWRHNISQRAAE